MYQILAIHFQGQRRNNRMIGIHNESMGISVPLCENNLYAFIKLSSMPQQTRAHQHMAFLGNISNWYTILSWLAMSLLFISLLYLCDFMKQRSWKGTAFSQHDWTPSLFFPIHMMLSILWVHIKWISIKRRDGNKFWGLCVALQHSCFYHCSCSFCCLSCQLLLEYTWTPCSDFCTTLTTRTFYLIM